MKKYSDEYYTHLADLYASDYDEACIEDSFHEDEYEKRRKEIFGELVASILPSKYLDFERIVLKRAWNLTAEALARKKSRKLNLDPIFYVYVLLDPRKPGTFKFKFPGGKILIFRFQPFYVGKGTGKRLEDHAKSARNRKHKGLKLSHKENRILDIEKNGKKAIEKVISTKTIEAVAFVKEILLIKYIGRRDTNTGPLTNLTDGGEGLSGYTHSAETVEKVAKKNRGRKHTPAARANMSAAAKGNPKSPQTPEHIEKRMRAHRGKPHLSLRGRKQTPEHIEKRIAPLRGRSNSLKGRKQTPERIEKTRIAMLGNQYSKGCIRSAETRAKMSASMTGIKRLTYTCPHCGLTGKGGNMKRYHFDNCKSLIKE